MSTTTAELLSRIDFIESNEEELMAEFRKAVGRCGEAIVRHKGIGRLHTAMRTTQLEQDAKISELLARTESHSQILHEHGFLLKGLEEGQKRLDGRMDKLDGRVDKLDGRMGRLEGRMERLERLIRRGFAMNGIKVDGDEE